MAFTFIRPVLGALLAGLALNLPADESDLLPAFDIDRDTVELQFENQAASGCLLSPYQARDAIEESLQQLGFRLSGASGNVLRVMTWGAETDDYHCAIVLETELRKYGLRVELGADRAVSTDLRLWGTSDLLTGPKIRMQERIEAKILQHIGDLHRAMN